MANLQETLRDYLNDRAAGDPLFAANYAKPHKNIEDCETYVMEQARKKATKAKGGSCGFFPDVEVFGWAVHYYDEDDIKVGTPRNCQVVMATEEAKPNRTIVKPTIPADGQITLF